MTAAEHPGSNTDARKRREESQRPPAETVPALTEQIVELLYEHLARTEKTGYIHGCKCGWSARPDKSYRTHVAEVLTARLADSRPAVTEAAIEAAAKVLFDKDPYERLAFAMWKPVARAALSAALPHMGDGKA